MTIVSKKKEKTMEVKPPEFSVKPFGKQKKEIAWILMNEPLGFGKYSKLSPKELLSIKPEYLVWMCSNFEVKSKAIAPDIYNAVGVVPPQEVIDLYEEHYGESSMLFPPNEVNANEEFEDELEANIPKPNSENPSDLKLLIEQGLSSGAVSAVELLKVISEVDKTINIIVELPETSHPLDKYVNC